MYFHGGGWIMGDAPTHDRLVRETGLLTLALWGRMVRSRRAPAAESTFQSLI
jgi:acetyl esterase/lipase